MKYMYSLLIIFCFPIVVFGQESTPTEGRSELREVAAHKLSKDATITLDGKMDEAIWQTAIPADYFLQREPVQRGVPTEKTEVYILYDSDNLYIGGKLYDSEPDKILAFQMQRDASLRTDDRFIVILDTFNDGRSGYFFETNAAGLMGDGLLVPDGRFGVNKSWDGIWEAQSSITSEGWVTEIRIPFQTLNFDPTKTSWGINFHRTIRRKNEELPWSGHQRSMRATQPIHAGTLTGLTGLSQGMGLEIKPYASAGWAKIIEDNINDYPSDAGIDLTYNVTSGLRASLTVNTDFAEVENDKRQVNLTQFSLRFEEKRDFFLEGANIFSFSPSNGIEPFYSRKIGLVDGNPIPVVFGGRLAGKVGKNEIGLLQLRTGEQSGIAQEDFTIGRYKRTFFEQSTIGAIFTRRSTGDGGDSLAGPDRYTYGFDLNMQTRNFMGDKNLQFEAFLVTHTDPEKVEGRSLDDLSSYGVRLNYPNDLWEAHASYREFGDEFNPAVGFTPRNGFKRFQPTIQFKPRASSIKALRQFEFEFEYERLADKSSLLETEKTKVKLLGLRFESGDNVDIDVTDLFWNLKEEFYITDDVIIPAGMYNTLFWNASIRTASKRRLSGEYKYSTGEFWSGTKTEYSIQTTIRPQPGFSLTIEYEYNDIDLPEGTFQTNVFSVSSAWDMSPWKSWTSLVQYDDVSKVMGMFTKYRWTINPGNDLYLVYTHNWNSTADRFLDWKMETLSQGATTKLNYTHRF